VRPGGRRSAHRLGTLTYEALLDEGDPAFEWPGPRDEWDALSLLYTSGTTAIPRASCITTAARTSTRSGTRSRSA
jgi:acyl-coenzyme A synthetase/AMP-(fatty) acid ligase